MTIPFAEACEEAVYDIRGYLRATCCETCAHPSCVRGRHESDMRTERLRALAAALRGAKPVPMSRCLKPTFILELEDA